MIQVNGQITLQGQFTLELNLTEEEFDSLTGEQQNHLIQMNVKLNDVIEQSEFDDIDIWDVETLA